MKWQHQHWQQRQQLRWHRPFPTTLPNQISKALAMPRALPRSPCTLALLKSQKLSKKGRSSSSGMRWVLVCFYKRKEQNGLKPSWQRWLENFFSQHFILIFKRRTKQKWTATLMLNKQDSSSLHFLAHEKDSLWRPSSERCINHGALKRTWLKWSARHFAQTLHDCTFIKISSRLLLPLAFLLWNYLGGTASDLFML